MSRSPEYVVFYETDLRRFQDKIDNAMVRGFTLQGGVCVIQHREGHTFFYQAMVRT